MKKTTPFIIWGTAPLLIPIGLAVILIVNLIAYNVEVFPFWLGFAYWALAALMVLISVWIFSYFYLKLITMLETQQLDREKLEKEKEVEKHLADKHQEYKMEVLKHEIQKLELDLKIKKLKKKKKE